MKLTLIVLTAATAFGAQESHLSVSDPTWKESRFTLSPK